MDKEIGDRIYIKNSSRRANKSNLNRKIIERMKDRMDKKGKRTRAAEGTGDDLEELIQDDRFKGYLDGADFKINEQEEDFLLRNPNMKKKGIRKY